MRFLLPLALFIAVVVFLAAGLERDPSLVPSPLIGKPLPAYTLGELHDAARQRRPQDLAGRPTLLNVWASWCAACRDEHPLLVELARTSDIPIVGINYKDERDDALRWLEQRGDPYRYSLFDNEGSLGLDLGVYGVPETFVIDSDGTIRYKHVGPLTPAILNDEILPLLAPGRS